MTQASRIILNTVASYGKSIITLPLNLLSARWVLQGLGVDDFGLQGVVGGIVYFITFVNSVSSQAVSRFYAYAIGVELQGASKSHDVPGGEKVIPSLEVRHWFNTALSVHIFLPFVIIAIGYPVGVYAIRHWLVIPSERIDVAVWVFRMSLVAAFFGMLYVPYVAMYLAHQLITNITMFTILTSVCSATFAYCFAHVGGDRLLVYAAGTLLISVFIGGLQAICAHRRFSQARISGAMMFDVKRISEMLSFAWWRLLASVGYVLRTQGSALLVNLHFGVSANAAMSVANQLASQTAAFSAHLGNALMPAIVTSAGAKRRQDTIDLALRSCKFGTLLVLLFAIPMIAECDAVLHYWLVNPPKGASALCICMVASFVIERFVAGHDYALNAAGKIASWQIWEMVSHVSSLLVAWLLICLGFSAVSIGYVYISTSSLLFAGRIYYARKFAAIGVRAYLGRVVVPVAICGAASCAVTLVVLLLPESFLRLCLTVSASMLTIALTAWFFAMDGSEKEYLKSFENRFCRCAGIKGSQLPLFRHSLEA